MINATHVFILTAHQISALFNHVVKCKKMYQHHNGIENFIPELLANI